MIITITVELNTDQRVLTEEGLRNIHGKILMSGDNVS